MNSQAEQPLNTWERIGLAGFLLLLIAFGGLVEIRTALLDRRMGDLDVFLRAAWAVRADEDLYHVTSDNDWHYLYPPLYAILLSPLADPPAGHEQTGFVPYAFSAAICYVFSLVCLFAGVHALANALEGGAGDADYSPPPRFRRRWWALRLWPVLVCVAPVGHTLMRGQVNLIVLGALCGAVAGWMRGSNFRAGLWLALAICIKVIPAFLLVYPLWKRDGRGLAGCVIGLLIGLVAIPVAVFGPTKTQTHYETYASVFFAPFFNLNDKKVLDEEILGHANATESIGVRNAVLNWSFPDPKTRPADLPGWGKAIYVALGAVLTLLTLWQPYSLRPSDTSQRAAQTLTGLIVLMAVFSPVCHSHYLAFCVPVVMCLAALDWRYIPTPRPSLSLVALCLIFLLTTVIAYLPGLEILKDRCASLFATLPLWALAVARLGRAIKPVEPEAIVKAWRMRTPHHADAVVSLSEGVRPAI